MKQIPLDVQLADHAVFETWFVGANGALLHALRQVSATGEPAVCWIWGAPESGKSHLLQACVNEADQTGFRAAYLPLGTVSGVVPAMVENMDELDLVCIDQIDRVAGQPDWEQALFVLFEGIRQNGARLVMAAGQAPAHSGFLLPDLVSRLSSGATFRIQPLTDDDKIRAMRIRARWRGLEMPEEVARFLYSRIARGNRYLFEMLERLDRKALIEQKRLTVPFVKSFLEDDGKSSETGFNPSG